MNIHLHARLADLTTFGDCRQEARRLVPEALRAIGAAWAAARDWPGLTEVERQFLINCAGRRFAQRADAAFRLQLEQKLFNQLWWSAPFPRLRRAVAAP